MNWEAEHAVDDQLLYVETRASPSHAPRVMVFPIPFLALRGIGGLIAKLPPAGGEDYQGQNTKTDHHRHMFLVADVQVGKEGWQGKPIIGGVDHHRDQQAASGMVKHPGDDDCCCQDAHWEFGKRNADSQEARFRSTIAWDQE